MALTSTSLSVEEMAMTYRKLATTLSLSEEALESHLSITLLRSSSKKAKKSRLSLDSTKKKRFLPRILSKNSDVMSPSRPLMALMEQRALSRTPFLKAIHISTPAAQSQCLRPSIAQQPPKANSPSREEWDADSEPAWAALARPSPAISASAKKAQS